MTEEELQEWKDLLKRCDDSGNDGADVYEAEEFARRMELKYGKTMRELTDL